MKLMLSGNEVNTDMPVQIEWSKAAMRFRSTVVKARPTLFLLTRSEQARLKQAQAKLQVAQNQKNGVDNVLEVSSDDEIQTHGPTKNEPPTTTPIDPVHMFRLEEIRDINLRYYQACVPGEIELKAKEVMNKLSVQHWNLILDTFMNDNSKLLNAQINKIVNECFKQCNHLMMSEVIVDCVKTFIDKAINAEWSYAEELCRLEREQSFTYDAETLKRKEAQCLRDRQEKRTAQRLSLDQVERAASGLASRNKRKPSEDELEPDPFQTELLMSVKNRAYYEVAATRFVYNVCMSIYGRLLPMCTERLSEELELKLGLNDPARHEKIIELMTEDPAREAKRRQLFREKKRLTEGLEYIRQVLGSKSTSPADLPRRRPRHRESPAAQPKTPSKKKKTTHASVDEDELPITPTPVRLVKRIRSVEIAD